MLLQSKTQWIENAQLQLQGRRDVGAFSAGKRVLAAGQRTVMAILYTYLYYLYIYIGNFSSRSTQKQIDRLSRTRYSHTSGDMPATCLCVFSRLSVGRLPPRLLPPTPRRFNFQSTKWSFYYFKYVYVYVFVCINLFFIPSLYVYRT